MQQAILTRQQAVMTTEYHRMSLTTCPAPNIGVDGSQRNFPALHINLLGMVSLVSVSKVMKSIDMPRLQSLLAYLVLHRGAPHSRTRLACLLWPDSSEAQAHTNLRNLLYKLRQALPDVNEILYADRQTLLWPDDGAWTLDVLDFQRAVARAEQAEQAEDSAALRVALEKAVELYRGELLPGCYDEWLLPERERLSQLFRDVLERLLHLHEQKGDYAGAISVAQQLLREDPLYEGGYRHLMRLYAVSGNRAAVVRTYQRCVAMLKVEFAVEPSPTTRSVYAQLVEAEKRVAYVPVRRTANISGALYA